MKICKELLYQELGRLLVRNFNELQFDYQQVIMTKSVQALNRIQEILQDDTLDDFYKIEKIERIFESCGVSLKNRREYNRKKIFPARLNNLKFFPAITTGNGRSLRTANTGQHESFYAVNAGIEKAGRFICEQACFFSSPIFFCLLLEKRIQKAENKKIKRI